MGFNTKISPNCFSDGNKQIVYISVFNSTIFTFNEKDEVTSILEHFSENINHNQNVDTI